MKEQSWGFMAIIFFGLTAGIYYIGAAIADLLDYGGIDVSGTAYYVFIDVMMIMFAVLGFIAAYMYKVRER